jgi:hypothetical protein
MNIFRSDRHIANHSSRAVKGMNSLRSLECWEVRMSLKAWISLFVYSIFVLSCVGSGLTTD